MSDLRAALASRKAAAAPPPFAFDFTDLSDMVRDPLEAPEQLVDGLLYKTGSHWVSGHPKAGKSLLVMHEALLLLAQGHHVCWLDYEGGGHRTARRLAEMGADPDMIEEFFHYVYAPRTTVTDPVIEAFEGIMQRWPGALVVFDSQAKALRRAGFSEDSADEVTEWTTSIVLHLANEHDACVVVIDHVTKNAGRGTHYARGSGAKAADADVSWFIERREEFNRHQPGSFEVILWHDRDGDLPSRHGYLVGPGDGSGIIQMRRMTADELYPVAPADADSDAAMPGAV
jgi:hypothetical protein